jgi:HlyD family secretion protein
MKRVITVILILAAVVSVSIYSYQILGRVEEQRTSARQVEGEIVVVERGSIEETVSATGYILPAGQALVNFKDNGRIVAVEVIQGQQVRVGDVLARLETADLEMALAKAEATLAHSEAQLAQARKQPTPEEITAAKAQVASAKADYEKKLAGPDPDEITSTKAALRKAEIALRKAQEEYDKVSYRSDIGLTPQAEALQQASIDYEKAKADFNLATKKPTEEDKQAAAAALAKAEADLAKLLRTPAPEDVAVAEAEVLQSRVGVEQARRDLENAVLVAPIDGIVAMVNARVGELANTSNQAFILTDLSSLHTDVQVDEVDVRRIAVGQPVSITLEALPDQEFLGRLVAIAPIASGAEALATSLSSFGDAGVPSYIVTVELRHNSPDLRVGMSANATIWTQRREGVLLIPNRAIQVDRETGKEYVEKLTDGETRRVEIKTGLSNGTDSEVLAGLEEGDSLVIAKVSAREMLRRSFQGE